MKSIKINGKKKTLSQAKAIIDKKGSVIKKVTLDLDYVKKKEAPEPPSHKGFVLEATIIGGLSAMKDRMAAGAVTLKMEKVAKINNSNFLVVIYDQPKGWRKLLFNLFLKVF